MKILDKIGLVVFSSIALLLSLALILTIAEWLDLKLVLNAVEYIVTNKVAARVTFGVCVVLILLAIKTIFLNSDAKSTSSGKEGILLENDNGKLLVSRDTIESLTNAVVKNYETAQNVLTKVELDGDNNVSVFITLFVYPDAVIKDLTVSLQNDVKSTIKKSLDDWGISEYINSNKIVISGEIHYVKSEAKRLGLSPNEYLKKFKYKVSNQFGKKIVMKTFLLKYSDYL